MIFPKSPTSTKSTGARAKIHNARDHPFVNPSTRPDMAIAIALEICPAFSPSARYIANVSDEIFADNSV